MLDQITDQADQSSIKKVRGQKPTKNTEQNLKNKKRINSLSSAVYVQTDIYQWIDIEPSFVKSIYIMTRIFIIFTPSAACSSVTVMVRVYMININAFSILCHTQWKESICNVNSVTNI